MEDYHTIKYIDCHLGLLKCEDCAFNCAFKGICKERFNYQCMANHQLEHLYGIDDKNYHFVLCEKDKFEKLDEKDKAGFISYLTDLYNFLYVHNADIRDDYTLNSITMKAIERKLELIDGWAGCLKLTLDQKYGNTSANDVILINYIQKLAKEIKKLVLDDDTGLTEKNIDENYKLVK